MRPHHFNTGWTCRPLDSDSPAVPVRLPHDAMLAEKRSAASPGGKNIGYFSGGDYLYEKQFIPDESWKSCSILLAVIGNGIPVTGRNAPGSPAANVPFSPKTEIRWPICCIP